MSTRLGDLVESLGGELIGDPDIAVIGIAPLDAATASHITFLSNPKLRAQASATRAGALVLSSADHSVVSESYKGACILTPNPYAWFARAAQVFAASQAQPVAPGIHTTASVHPSAQIDGSSSIGPHVTIEAGAVIGGHCVIGAGSFIGQNARIGAHTLFHPHVTFLAACEIGARGIVHSGAVIGADGFGFASDQGLWIKIPQTGRVRIGDDVEIGANTTIDRGALEDTVIEEGVKLSLIHI